MLLGCKDIRAARANLAVYFRASTSARSSLLRQFRRRGFRIPAILPRQKNARCKLRDLLRRQLMRPRCSRAIHTSNLSAVTTAAPVYIESRIAHVH